MQRSAGLARMPLLQINGVRVGSSLSPVKRQWQVPRDRPSKENAAPDDCDVIGLSPFKKRTRTTEPDAKPAIAEATAPPQLVRAPSARPAPRRSAVALLVQRFPDLRLTIDSLPVELVAYLFTFLCPEDLLRVSIVCRAWYEICDHRGLWLPHFLFPDEQPTQAACRWPARWAHYKRQTLAEQARREHDELFCFDLRLDRYEEMARLREAFREVDEFTLMEQ